MEQVSPEVKEAYLNNLTYTTINKKDWKALNRAYNVDNARDKQTMFDRSMFALSGLTVVMSFVMALILNSPAVFGFFLLFLIPLVLVVIEEKYDIVYSIVRKNDEFLHNYRKANETFYVLIEGNDKHRYYSRWYLELINPKVETTNKVGDSKYIRFNEVQIKRTNNYYTSIYDLVLYPVTRHADRFNWRNTLSTNRVLSIEEYKNLIKSKEEFKKYMELEEDIREFQEYNGLIKKETNYEQ